MSCHYCFKGADNISICISCDGKHEARKIHKLYNQEKLRFQAKFDYKLFPCTSIKELLIKSQIRGLAGLSEQEAQVFWDSFNREWDKLENVQENK